MIYRIAMYKDGAFQRHATDRELYRLRVNSSGLVESMIHELYEPFNGWQDVSDTHKVEWGVECNGFAFYDNDILETTVYAQRWVVVMRYDDYIGRMWIDANEKDGFDFGSFCPGFEETFKVIGYVHQNPELLEGR